MCRAVLIVNPHTTPRLVGTQPHTPSPYHTPLFIQPATAGEDQLGEALKGADVVIIPAGVPRKPGMTRDDLFKINAGGCGVLVLVSV